MSLFIKPDPKEHFNSFMNLLNSIKPFTFIRFSDGEVEVLRNRKLTISNKKTFMLSRTYDDISFPNKKNAFYNEFRKFYLSQLTINNISKIYLVFDRTELEQSKKRYIYEYIDQECFKSELVNDIFIKMNLNNCKSIK